MTDPTAPMPPDAARRALRRSIQLVPPDEAATPPMRPSRTESSTGPLLP